LFQFVEAETIQVAQDKAADVPGDEIFKERRGSGFEPVAGEFAVGKEIKD
jgi:hypothetical protein